MQSETSCILVLPEKSGLVQANLCRGSTSRRLSNKRESTLGSPLRENRTAGFAWGFGRKGEILRPNSISHTMNQDRLIGRLGKLIEDKRILKLVGIMLRSGVMKDGVVTPTREGAIQGSPLSPLLSNLVLDELDKEIEARGLKFCRFADDCNIFVKTQRAAERVMKGISKFIEKKLKLVVNREKSQVAESSPVKFLGMTIINGT